MCIIHYTVIKNKNGEAVAEYKQYKAKKKYKTREDALLRVNRVEKDPNTVMIFVHAITTEGGKVLWQ